MVRRVNPAEAQTHTCQRDKTTKYFSLSLSLVCLGEDISDTDYCSERKSTYKYLLFTITFVMHRRLYRTNDSVDCSREKIQ